MSEMSPIYAWTIELTNGRTFTASATSWVDDTQWIRFYLNRPWLPKGSGNAVAAFRTGMVAGVTRVRLLDDQQLTSPED